MLNKIKQNKIIVCGEALKIQKQHCIIYLEMNFKINNRKEQNNFC